MRVYLPDLPGCILQVSATLEKQVRAKEKELIAFQEKYKIRLKVSRDLRYKVTSRSLWLPVEPSISCRGKGTRKRRLLRSRLLAKTDKEVLGSLSQSSKLQIQLATNVSCLDIACVIFNPTQAGAADAAQECFQCLDCPHVSLQSLFVRYSRQ